MLYYFGENMVESNKPNKREELINKISDSANELESYVSSLMTDVDDAVDESDDPETTVERLEEIYKAVKKATENQWQGLNL